MCSILVKGTSGHGNHLRDSLLLRTRHEFPGDNLPAPRLALILSSHPAGEDSIHAKLCLDWNSVFITLHKPSAPPISCREERLLVTLKAKSDMFLSVSSQLCNSGSSFYSFPAVTPTYICWHLLCISGWMSLLFGKVLSIWEEFCCAERKKGRGGGQGIWWTILTKYWIMKVVFANFPTHTQRAQYRESTRAEGQWNIRS